MIAIGLFLLMARRYRFSLRTLLIVTTLFGTWLGLKVGHDMKLQRAITDITNAGGHLKVHDRRPNFPWGLWAERYHLHFYALREPLTGGQLARLELFAPSSLWSLDLTNSGITDESLRFVARFANVQSLSLANDTYATGERIPGRPQNQMSDAGFAKLRGMRELRSIQLGGTDVTDECVTYLLLMPNLKCIYLDGTKITGSGISRLGTLKELWLLELNGCPISADGYKELGQLKNVRHLALCDVGMRDADLEELNKMWQLTSLFLWKSNVSEESLKRFSDEHPNCRIQRLRD
ncbi:MAG: hypothetical protein WD738_24075 [Pirellulales bacterium]